MQRNLKYVLKKLNFNQNDKWIGEGMMNGFPPFEELITQILGMVEVAWRNRLDRPLIERWLANFTGEAIGNADREKKLALWLLYNFTYYNEEEIRYLCRLLFRKYLHASLANNRLEMMMEESTEPHSVSEEKIYEILRQSIFLPLGKNSESGAYILYLFRQENDLPIDFFDVTYDEGDDKIFVFVDDMTLSGNQAMRNLLKEKYRDYRLTQESITGSFSRTLETETKKEKLKIKREVLGLADFNIQDKKELAEEINKNIIRKSDFFKKLITKRYFKVVDKTLQELVCKYETNQACMTKFAIYKMNRLLLEYVFDKEIAKSKKIIENHKIILLTLIASEKAKKVLNDEKIKIINCIDLDETAKAFSPESLIFSAYESEKADCKRVCEFYGKKITAGNQYMQSFPLGYDDCQYLLGLYYTIPNNTLPVFWAQEGWSPIFLRHDKRYGGVADVSGKFI